MDLTRHRFHFSVTALIAGALIPGTYWGTPKHRFACILCTRIRRSFTSSAMRLEGPAASRRPRRPDSRLVTQNLVLSAAFALEGHPYWSSIRDLAVLIELFCMYDSATALGRGIIGGRFPELGDLLIKSGFLQLRSPTDDKTFRRVVEVARCHIRTYYAGRERAVPAKGKLEKSPGFVDMLASALNHHEFQNLTSVPESPEEGVDYGDLDDLDLSLFLHTDLEPHTIPGELQEKEGQRRAARFIARTFLYIAYQEVSGLVFVPDAVRESVIEDVVAMEDVVRGKLLAALKVQETHASDVRRLSPLAAVVFERASHRSRIIQEMKRLRDELAPLRERLRKAERKIFYGKGTKVGAAKAEWEMVAAELKKSFGDQPQVICLRSILRFGSDAGELADEPLKAKSWMTLLLGLPFEAASRLLSRRPAIELHHLRREMPGSIRLWESVQRLLGPHIQDY